MRISRNWHLTGILGTTPEAPSGATSRQFRRKPPGLQDTERPGQGLAGDLVRLPPRRGVQREVGHRPVGKLVDGGNASSRYPVETGDVPGDAPGFPVQDPHGLPRLLPCPAGPGARVFPAVGAVAYPVEGVLHRDGVEVGERPSAVLVAARPEAVVVDAGVLLADRAEGGLSAGIAQGIDVCGRYVVIVGGLPIAEPDWVVPDASCGAGLGWARSWGPLFWQTVVSVCRATSWTGNRRMSPPSPCSRREGWGGGATPVSGFVAFCLGQVPINAGPGDIQDFGDLHGGHPLVPEPSGHPGAEPAFRDRRQRRQGFFRPPG